MNKKGVFGLTAVQMFFAMILLIAIICYIIVLIMGILSSSTILGNTATNALYEYSVNKSSDVQLQIYDGNWEAQTFTVGTDGTNENFNLTKLSLLLGYAGSGGGENLSILIVGVNSSGSPNMSNILSAKNITSSGMSNSMNWKDLVMPTVTLNKSTQYAIVLTTKSNQGLEYYMISATNPVDYSGGLVYVSYNSGSTWSKQDGGGSYYTSRFRVYGNTIPTVFQNNANSILGNTSTGILSFFTSINPVYAILAVLVIILVLIVLVRVVQEPNRREGNSQL